MKPYLKPGTMHTMQRADKGLLSTCDDVPINGLIGSHGVRQRMAAWMLEMVEMEIDKVSTFSYEKPIFGGQL